MKTLHSRIALVLAALCCAAALTAAAIYIPNLLPFRDSTGFVSTYNTSGDIDESNAFFQQLGTNGRTCATCHQIDQGMGLELGHVRHLFAQGGGKDPLFAAVDGANCPGATQGDEAAHSMLLNNGLIRIGITLPEKMEFDISVVNDPYGCAITTDPNTGRPVVSVYRRPLPSTSLNFLSAVMWDGRETLKPLNDERTFAQNIRVDLKQQAIDAVLGHAQGKQPPTESQLNDILSLELGLYTAQIRDDHAAPLDGGHGRGGALWLQQQPYYPGINDSLGNDPHGDAFNPEVFTIYSKWVDDNPQNDPEADPQVRAARANVAAGERLFNTAPLRITAVRGLNDNPNLGYPQEITGTCTTCHDSPNVGNHSVSLPLDIATSHVASLEDDATLAAALTELSQPAAPVFLVSNCPDPQNPTRKLTFYTSDPGKALVTGKCADVNRVKGPVLRGLASRAPYFHNGSASNLEELVNFYNKRFQMNLSDDQKRQLIAFLNAL
jgi:hypothetical protein